MSKELNIERYGCIATNSKSDFKKVEKWLDWNPSEIIQKKSLKPWKKNWTVSRYSDLKCGLVKEDLYLMSQIRGCVFIVKNLSFILEHDQDKTVKNLNMLFNLLNKSDSQYNIENSEQIDSDMYLKILTQEYMAVCHEEDVVNTIRSKQDAKKEAKKAIRFHYRIGDFYVIKRKTVTGDIITDDIYKVKKFIYTISNNIVNIVVMKQISGVKNQRKSLSHIDCKAFHIKYESDLYVFPMNSNFYKLTVEEKDKRIGEFQKRNNIAAIESKKENTTVSGNITAYEIAESKKEYAYLQRNDEAKVFKKGDECYISIPVSSLVDTETSYIQNFSD